MGDFFIMMNAQKGGAICVISEHANGDACLYTTEAEAREVAENHYWCREFGYEIFERGGGC